MYYRECPICGGLLDPGEQCECMEKDNLIRQKYDKLTTVNKDGQLEIRTEERKRNYAVC